MRPPRIRRPPRRPTEKEQPDDPFSGTYWPAVRRELTDDDTDALTPGALPTENRWADLWLNEDGAALYREVMNNFYSAEIHGGRWQQEGNTLRLTVPSPDSVWPTLDGHLEGDRLVMEYNGQRFYLEQAEPPAPGGELCAADVRGT